jgi:predicted RNA-binding protein YlqC (UPF0109 family)
MAFSWGDRERHGTPDTQQAGYFDKVKVGTVEKDLIEYIAKSIVDDPSSVTVRAVNGEKTTVLELEVAEGDIGKIIGKHGRIAKAIRTVLQAAATRGERHVTLEILD